MYGKWLISEDYKARIQTALAGKDLPTLEQIRAHREEAAAKRSAAGGPSNYRVEGNTAYISVTGLLTAEPDLWCEYFGLDNTTYPDIAESVARAEGDPTVKRVVYEISSGGGTVAGITDAVYAIDSARKPSSVVSDYAASAAYWIATRASVGGKITATSPMASFGSIGVAVDVYAFAFVKQIASTDAPNKRPDVNTEEGRQAIREELDAIHDHFAGDVADARGVSRDKVNSDFGRGGMLLADAAKLAGMIDEVVARPAPARKGNVDSALLPKAENGSYEVPVTLALTMNGKPSSVAEVERLAALSAVVPGLEVAILDGKSVAKQPPEEASHKELKSMDLATLKASHPDLFKAVREEGITAGVAQERERVAAHLTLAEASGDQAYSLKCINDGTGITMTVQTTHMAAAMKRGAQSARDEDGKGVDEATQNAASKLDPNSEAAEIERENRIGDILNQYAAN
jgi:ClpP class serine protease